MRRLAPPRRAFHNTSCPSPISRHLPPPTRQAYEARERDANGKVKTTAGRAFRFWGTAVNEKNKAKAADRRVKLARAKFKALDTDGSGTLSKKEVRAGAEALGMTVTRAVEWWDDLNREGGGTGEVPMELFLERCVPKPSSLLGGGAAQLVQ